MSLLAATISKTVRPLPTTARAKRCDQPLLYLMLFLSPCYPSDRPSAVRALLRDDIRQRIGARLARRSPRVTTDKIACVDESMTRTGACRVQHLCLMFNQPQHPHSTHCYSVPVATLVSDKTLSNAVEPLCHSDRTFVPLVLRRASAMSPRLRAKSLRSAEGLRPTDRGSVRQRPVTNVGCRLARIPVVSSLSLACPESASPGVRRRGRSALSAGSARRELTGAGSGLIGGREQSVNNSLPNTG